MTTDMHPENRPQHGPHQPHVVCRHADVVAAAGDPDTFSSAVSRHLQIPNGLDGTEHARFRPLIDAFFTSDRMAELEPVLADLAGALLAGLPRDREIDAVDDLGTPYAVRATCAWLGWPLSMEVELRGWMRDNHAATRSGDYARTSEVAARFDAIIRRLIDERTGPAAPRDVTAELVRAEVDGRPLTEEEVVSVLRNWTAGDITSVALCVGVVVRYLAEHPDVQHQLRAHLAPGAGDAEGAGGAGGPDGRTTSIEVLDRAVDEILRIDDPFVANRRVATTDARLGDLEVAEGQRLLLHWREANRDPERFPEPDRYDPDAHAEHNLVYGTGPHVCPGRPLATLELRMLLVALLRATASWEPGGEPEREQPPLGGYHRAPVVLRGSATA